MYFIVANIVMLKTVSQIFSDHFGKSPQILVRAPGRINLIGEHTDYNKGYVLPAAINRYMNFAISENGSDDRCSIYAADLGDHVEFPLNVLNKSDKGWANYFIGILLQLLKKGKELRGFDLVFGGDIPIGAGLSSSSALECGFLKGINDLFHLQLSNHDIIAICHKSNHEFLGLRGGIMDHFAILFGKEEHAIRLNCDTLDHSYVPLDFGQYAVMLIDSKVSHNLIYSAYNDRVKEVEQALEIVRKKYPKVRHLSMLTDLILKAVEGYMPDIIFRRAKFVKEENERVHKFCTALKIKDYDALGALLYASHKGLRYDYEVSCEEMDFLVDLTTSNEYVLGARMMGGGFGGCTINLIEKTKAKEVVASILNDYRNKSGIDAKSYLVNITNGVLVS